QAEDGIRDFHVTGVQTCALPILIEQLKAQQRDSEQQLEAIAEATPRAKPPAAAEVVARTREPAPGRPVERRVDAPGRTYRDLSRSAERRAGKERRRRRSPWTLRV